jgi:hypothetical protein
VSNGFGNPEKTRRQSCFLEIRDRRERSFGDYLDLLGRHRANPLPNVAEMKQVCLKCTAALESQETLERHFREVQDMEFTIQEGKLYMLQTRNAKMNAAANIKTSVDMLRTL